MRLSRPRHDASTAFAGFLVVVLLVPLAARAAESIQLFNGKNIDGWTTFVDARAKDVGPDDIWTVEDGVIKCRGHVPGYLLSEDEFENYVLRLEWRWGDEVARGRNSGVFVHTVGENKIWPKGVEAQLASGSAGDFWLVGGAKLKVDSKRQDPNVARHYYRMKKDGVEKPLGEWNRYEITCQDGEIRLVINGQEVNVGTEGELTRGRILLQSEGAEIHFRNIEVEPLD